MTVKNTQLTMSTQLLSTFSTLTRLGTKRYSYTTDGTIQVLRHQRGGWVGTDNDNF